MIVYAVGVDQGDGSVSVEFFDDPKTIEYLEDKMPEYYRNEGYYVTLDIDLELNPGVNITTMADAVADYEEMF